jgi:hypothetical protein
MTPAFTFRIPHSAFRILFLLLLAGSAEGQVDPSGTWRTLHTPHFRVHFRPAYRDVALRGAREAERSYALLASELHPPRGKVDLTLGDDIDGSNGFTTVFPSSRITILAPPPANSSGLLFYDTWLRLVTTHELAHVFHLDRSKSFWGVAQRLFGRAPGLFPHQYQPTWVIEGLATYYESKFTNGGRVRGSFHTQILAADRAAGSSRSPWEALPFTRWPNGYAAYAYGSRFLDHLARTVGDSVVPRFAERTAGQLIPFRVGRQIGRVAPGRTLAGEWSRGTLPEPAPGEPVRGTLVIDSLLRTEPVPRVSPDGHRVAYLRDTGKGAAELRVLDVGTLREVAVHQVNSVVSHGWLGDTLFVTQLDYATRWRVRSDLYRWVPGGRGIWRRETHQARLTQPAGGGGRLVAIKVGPDAARPTVPAPGPAGATWEGVVPSPDGHWIVGTRNAEGRWALVRWPVDSPAAAAVLVESRGALSDPVWTTGGDLWFVADPSGLPQVYRWRDSAGVAEPLTAEPLGARAPAPLGDGSLVYATLSARGWELRCGPALAIGTASAVTWSAPLPFDSAPAVPVRETGYALWPSLRPHFWIPLFLDAGPSGRFFGAATAGADALGRVSYFATGLIAPDPFRATGSFGGVWHGLGRLTLDGFAASSWEDVRGGGVTLSERQQDAVVGVSFVTRRWRTFASVRVAGEFEGRRFVTIPDTSLADVCPGCDNRDLAGGSVTVTLLHTETGPLAISPEDGFAWSATYRRREEQGGSRFSNEVRSRLSLYARIPGLGGFAHHVVALRLAAGATGGPLGGLLKVGGVSARSIALTFGQSVGGTRSFPVRGYGGNELRGQRAATATIEYRLPLALIGKPLGHLPFGADKLWLNLFGDAGDAWAPSAKPRLTRLRSTGLELVSDLTISYDLLIQARLGVAQPLADPPSGGARRPQVYVALASDF